MSPGVVSERHELTYELVELKQTLSEDQKTCLLKTLHLTLTGGKLFKSILIISTCC